MRTVYDWVSMGMFAALVVLFLQRSMAEGEPKDRIWHYAPAAVGCALANYLGNLGVDSNSFGLQTLAVAVELAVIVYSFVVLKPFGLKL